MMNLVFEKISQPLAAGAKLDIGIAGSFLRLSECQWPVTISLIRQGMVIGTMNNMLAGDYVQGVDFDAVWVINGATAQVVGIQISGGGAGSNRVLGEVSVIDGAKQVTLAGKSFSGGHAFIAGAGNYPHVVLSNPAASGINVVVSKLAGSIGLTGYLTTRSIAGAPGTLVKKATNKLMSGAVSVAEIRQFESASVTGSEMYTTKTIADTQIKIDPIEPVIIPPGYSLTMVSGGIASHIAAYFDFREEPI